MNKKDHLKSAIILYKKKNYVDSKKLLKEILINDPKNYEANKIIGLIEYSSQNYEQAIKFFQNCLYHKKEDRLLFLNIAYTLMLLRQYKDANYYFEKILPLLIEHTDICLNYSINLNYLEKFDKSVQILQNFNKYKLNRKDRIKILLQLANTYLAFSKKNYQFKKKYLFLCMDCIKQILEIDKNNFSAKYLEGLCNLSLHNISASIESFQKSILINNTFMPVYRDISIAYNNLPNYIKAEFYLNKYISANESDLDAKSQLSLIQLKQNNFIDGWKNFEFRDYGRKNKTKLNFHKPKWEPEMGYNRILIWGDLGIGDQILFSTILDDVIKKFNRVFLLIEKKLIFFLKEKFLGIHYLDKDKDFLSEDNFDYHLPLSSLGLFFRSNISNFKKNNPKKIFSNNYDHTKKKLKCALSWKSISPTGTYKSIDLSQIINLLSIKNIDFYNCQYSNEQEEIDMMKRKYGVDIITPNNLNIYDDIKELGEFLKTCDFSITISNTMAHISGFLGVPTYLLLPKASGVLWYWLNESDGINIWYPSIKKFQQTHDQSWKEPVNDLYNFLLKKYHLSS